MRGFLSFLFDTLVPPLCAHCGSEMWDRPTPEGLVIPAGFPPAFLPFLESGPPALCRDCWLGLEVSTGAPAPAGFRIITPFLTNEVLLSLVRFLKFEGGASAAVPLSWWMAWALRRWDDLSGVEPLLVPVPLHVRRVRGRGYNQAALLARGIAGHLDLRCEEGSVKRLRHTRSQARLADSERDRNVRGAFRLLRAPLIRGRHIILVDDLVTSGSTARSCIASILPAGPARVTVCAVGRRKVI